MTEAKRDMRVCAIIVAAGVGSRMGGPVNKHLLQIAGRPVLAHTLSTFQESSAVDDIVLVGGKDRLAVYRDMVKVYGISKVRSVVQGGATRQESCARGLDAAGDADILCVHDGARPLVTQRVIAEAIRQAAQHGAAIVGVLAKDTIKVATADGYVEQTLERGRLWQIQTPQVARAGLLRRAHAAARGVFEGTDDAVLLERLGIPVKLVQGEYSNIKITTVEDLAVAEVLLQQMAAAPKERE